MKLKPITFFLFFLFAFTAVLVAQTAPAGPIDDAAAQAFFAKFSKWQLFLVPLVTTIVWGVKKLIPAIPPQVLPIVAPFVGVALDYVGSKFGFWSGNVAAGAVLGGLGTWFNEFQSQGRELVAPTDKPTP